MTQPSARRADGTWVAVDAAERDTIGSNEALRVGQLCFVLDEDVTYVCATVAGGDLSTWFAPGRFTLTGGWAGTTAARFLSFTADAENAVDTVIQQQLAICRPWRLDRFSLNTSSAGNSTLVETHIDGGGVATSDTQTVLLGIAIDFDLALDIAIDEVLSILIDPTNSIGNLRWTLEGHYTG